MNIDNEQAQTSGERLAEQTALVRFAFQWLATHPITSFDFAEGHTPRPMIERAYTDAIKGYAKQIADDPHYVGEVVGMFFVNPRQCEPGGVDAATWGQT